MPCPGVQQARPAKGVEKEVSVSQERFAGTHMHDRVLPILWICCCRQSLVQHTRTHCTLTHTLLAQTLWHLWFLMKLPYHNNCKKYKLSRLGMCRTICLQHLIASAAASAQHCVDLQQQSDNRDALSSCCWSIAAVSKRARVQPAGKTLLVNTRWMTARAISR